jgi:hypothetical protein
MNWITFELLYFLFPVAITLHNIEEAVWMPEWSQNAGRWHRPVEKIPFGFAVLVLTLLAYLFAYLGLMGGKQSIGIYLLSGYAFVMLANVFVPHLIAAIWLKQYVPGLVTGLALNLPICSALLIFVLVEGYVSLWPLLITGGLFIVAALILIPQLFKAGEKIEERYWG